MNIEVIKVISRLNIVYSPVCIPIEYCCRYEYFFRRRTLISTTNIGTFDECVAHYVHKFRYERDQVNWVTFWISGWSGGKGDREYDRCPPCVSSWTAWLKCTTWRTCRHFIFGMQKTNVQSVCVKLQFCFYCVIKGFPILRLWGEVLMHWCVIPLRQQLSTAITCADWIIIHLYWQKNCVNEIKKLDIGALLIDAVRNIHPGTVSSLKSAGTVNLQPLMFHPAKSNIEYLAFVELLDLLWWEFACCISSGSSVRLTWDDCMRLDSL